MAFSALISTMDSAFSAVGSLFGVDVRRIITSKTPLPLSPIDEQNFNQRGDPSNGYLYKNSGMSWARMGMVIVFVLGFLFASFEPSLLWIFFLQGMAVSAVFFPVLFSVFSDKYSESSAFYSVLISFLGGMGFCVFSQVLGNPDLVTWGAIFSVGVGLVFGAKKIL